MERVVNIIGLGASAETSPDTGENWCINVAYKRLHQRGLKIDKMFFFDDFKHIQDEDNIIEPIEYRFDNFVQDHPECEIISRTPDKVIAPDGSVFKEVKAFDLKAAIKIINNVYFTSSVPYIIAHAILEKVDRIRLYGFEMWTKYVSNEYMQQRRCVDIWLGVALGKGIKIENWPMQETNCDIDNLYCYTTRPK